MGIPCIHLVNFLCAWEVSTELSPSHVCSKRGSPELSVKVSIEWPWPSFMHIAETSGIALVRMITHHILTRDVSFKDVSHVCKWVPLTYVKVNWKEIITVKVNTISSWPWPLDCLPKHIPLGLSPIVAVTPHGLLMLRNYLIDFAVEHWFGCHATESGFAGDIGAIEVWLIYRPVPHLDHHKPRLHITIASDPNNST